jgi:hypothetical protein
LIMDSEAVQTSLTPSIRVVPMTTRKQLEVYQMQSKHCND